MHPAIGPCSDLVESGLSQGSASQEMHAACPSQKSTVWLFCHMEVCAASPIGQRGCMAMALQLWLKKMTQGAPQVSSGCVSSLSRGFMEQQGKDPL